MSFDRARLPDIVHYLEDQGLTLIGQGQWKTTACTLHGGSDSMRVNTASGGWVCMACGAKGGDALAYHMQATEQDFTAAAKDLGAWVDDDQPPGQVREIKKAPSKALVRPLEAPSHRGLSDWAQRLWAACTGLRGTIGEDYLHARHCAMPPENGDLRFHPRLWHPSGYEGPALAALITDAVTREPISIHRTWITPAGKADVDPPRLLLKDHPKKGGVVRLWPDESVGYGLAVTEGIETALSLAPTYCPVWSLIDASNMAAFPVLAGIESLVIGADHDQVGLAAAKTCADRWTSAGALVRVIVPPREGMDWNDVERLAA
jgi:putative DNA primase/helicase